jgi:hypothetical protein
METIAWRFTTVAAPAGGQSVVASPSLLGMFMAQPIRGPPVPARRRRGYQLAAPPEGFIVTGTEGPLREGKLARARE